MTNDELEALKKAAQGCEAFQTKSKIFEEGWKAHSAYMDSRPSVIAGMKYLALQRDFELIMACAREIANAVSNSSLYVARERLRKVLEYFKETAQQEQSSK